MHDLNTIRDLNAKQAADAGLTASLKAGKFVLAQFAGLHLLRGWEFATLAEAEAEKARIEAENRHHGDQLKIFEPKA